ncbi:MAG TPA: hypothetical protein VMT30_04015 [Candidatus Saccharimonadia bacterium]|nr:hypothetical protein [Candidatus Saccharimonadia bacterium]
MTYKDFGGWSVQKLTLEQSTNERYFYEREIWWASIGHNMAAKKMVKARVIHDQS